VFGLAIHAVVFLVVNALLVALWVVTSGSTDELRTMAEHPSDSLDASFWPIWSILVWGAALLIHAAVAVATIPRRARRALTSRSRPPAVRHTDGVVHDAQPRRRWLVVMFTDICDSTSANERLGDDAWHDVLAHYRAVVRSVVASRSGSEIATAGDGFLLSFDSPAEAVMAGVDIQHALADARAADPTVPHTRIGLHAGDVVDDGTDVLGHVVNLASRVSSAAEPDEILVTEPVADQLVGSLRVEDRGLQPLKGLSQPRHLLAVRWDEAATTPPSD
jgi:class 3 adenylate cyclase